MVIFYFIRPYYVLITNYFSYDKALEIDYESFQKLGLTKDWIKEDLNFYYFIIMRLIISKIFFLFMNKLIQIIKVLG